MHMQRLWREMTNCFWYLPQQGEIEEFCTSIQCWCFYVGFSFGWKKVHGSGKWQNRLKDAVYKWFVQKQSCGVNGHGVELCCAADTLAKHVKIYFKASDGWLWHFCKHQGIVNRRTFGESLSDTTEETEWFKKFLNELIEKEGLILS
jgi:hypothetical protein